MPSIPTPVQSNETTKTVQITNNDLQDPTSLFLRYTVDQLNEIESKIRTDIERKREDLRQMVGERYRDIIEAADTIDAMHHCTRDIVDSLHGLREAYTLDVRPLSIKAGEAFIKYRCQQNEAESSKNISAFDDEAKPDPKPAVTWRDAFDSQSSRQNYMLSVESKNKAKLFEIACNTRVLIELSDNISRALSKRRLFQAAELCSLGQQCMARLTRESTKQSLFQVVPALVRPFEKLDVDFEAVKRTALDILTDPEISLEEATDAAACLSLLSDFSVEKTVELIVEKRFEFVEEIFDDGAKQASIKDQASSLTSIIQNTIQLVYALFGQPTAELVKLKTNLVANYMEEKTLKCKSLKLAELFDQYETWMNPVEFNYKYSLKPVSDPSLNMNEIFLRKLIEISEKRMPELFSYVQSVRALGNVRNAVWQVMVDSISKSKFYIDEAQKDVDTIPEWAMGLDNVEKIQKPSCLILWLDLLNHFFGTDVWPENQDIWTLFFRKHFMARSNEIIEVSLKNALKDTEERLELSITETINGKKEEVSSDVIFKSGTDWVFSEANSKEENNLTKSLDIVMKSQGFSPRVQILCKQVNKMIAKTLGDVFYCLDQVEEITSSSLEVRLLNKYKSQSGPSDTFAEDTKHATKKFIDELTTIINGKIETEECTDVVLYLSRVCQALTSNTSSPELKKALTGMIDKNSYFK